MTGAELKVRDRQTGETLKAFKLDNPCTIAAVDGDHDLDTDAPAGAILIFDEERHPDWPEPLVVCDVFGPTEMTRFERFYEIVESQF